MILEKNYPLYSKIQWVIKAISKADTRTSLTRICIERDDESIHIIGCDGHRVHRVILHKDNYNLDDIKLQSGLYIPTSSKSQIVLTLDESDDTGKYPPYKNLIPEKSDRYEYDLTYDGSKKWYVAYTKFLLIFQVTLNPDYFKDVLDVSGSWKVYIDKTKGRLSKAVYFESGDYSGLVQPIYQVSDIEDQIKEFQKVSKPVFNLEE